MILNEKNKSKETLKRKGVNLYPAANDSSKSDSPELEVYLCRWIVLIESIALLVLSCFQSYPALMVSCSSSKASFLTSYCYYFHSSGGHQRWDQEVSCFPFKWLLSTEVTQETSTRHINDLQCIGDNLYLLKQTAAPMFSSSSTKFDAPRQSRSNCVHMS